MPRSINKQVTGRPPKYRDVKTLQKKIDEYFATTPREEWTMTGLCIVLDIELQTLLNYERRYTEFVDPIKIARRKVHNEYERDLRARGRSGDIFALKNFGWTDRQDVNHGGQDDNPIRIVWEGDSADAEDTV